MSTQSKTTRGPLETAAAELEAELHRYEQTSAELERAEVNSEKSLQRARKLLEASAAHQERLAVLLPTFAEAMQSAQGRQQRCMDLTAEGTARIKNRFEERLRLLERVAALGERAQEINAPVAAVAAADKEQSPGDIIRTLEELARRTEAVIEEADGVRQAASEADWVDIARDADALKQQLSSARNRLLLAQRNVADSAPS